MASNIFLPSLVRTVDSNLQTIITSAWARRMKKLWWPRIARTRSSSTRVEFIQWLLETAKIRPINQGGASYYGDMMAASFEIDNTDYGDNLNLTANQIEDALGGDAAKAGQKNALDYAGSWARHIGNAGAYWPQQQVANFMHNGHGVSGSGLTPFTSYDGGAFFRTGHPSNPVTGAGSFDNLMTGRPFTPSNYALICAYIETIVAPDALPRHLVPRIVAAGPDNRLAVMETLGARSGSLISDPMTAAGSVAQAGVTNIVSELFELEPPVIAADLAESGIYKGTWWIGCELVEDDELAGVIYQERQAFGLNSYTPMSDPDLARMDSFEWKLKGRNAIAGGHPFLLFRIEPNGTVWTPTQPT